MPVEAKPSIKVKLRNVGNAPRAVYDVRRQPVLIYPGEQNAKVVDLSEHMLGVIRRTDGVLVAEEVQEGKAPVKQAEGSGQPRKRLEGEVEIPENWRDLPWFTIRSLATKVSTTPINTKVQAAAAITAYLKSKE